MPDTFPPQIITLFEKYDLFDATWYNATYPDVALTGLKPHAHYKKFGVLLGRAPNADMQQQLKTLTLDDIAKQAKAVLAMKKIPVQPPEFDDAFYLQTNPHIDHRRLSPYAHYLKYGHKDLRAPNADFDIVWYVQNYGHTYDADAIDPFTHYLQTGKADGNLSHPPRHVTFDKSASRTLPVGARRACLFAGYDADARIDDYVIIYLTELAKHADVYYMADCDMPKSELSKLDGIVKQAWAWRHGSYDFGSYSILARDLVGWDKLAKYDEVLFVNDSCYLVQPLDETFTRMNQKSCAWWGLQATKGIASTRSTQPFPTTSDTLSIDKIITELLSQFELDPIYDFLIGSFFMAFRSDVIRDERFQRVINNIQPEKRKLNVIRKYEVGLTRFLIGHGYEFATWAPTTTATQPVYTDVAFDLLANGFPVFKRFMLAENPYRVSSIAYWKTALAKADSITSIAQVEDNYLRVSNAQKLYRNFNIIDNNVLVQPPMGTAEFAAYDESRPKYDHYWGFPVCFYDQNLSDNARAVFEQVKDDPDIIKVIFTRDRVINPGGINVICVPLLSYEGQTYLTRCRNLFVRHGIKRNLHWPVYAQDHNIINLWHGIPLKRIGTASLDMIENREPLQIENSKLRAVICASDVDRLAMTAAYAPLPYENIWLTGLPRHDFITNPETTLPAYLRRQLADIRALTDGRDMILFCPTFRNDQENGYYNFTPDQVSTLTDWLRKHNMVMGIREHLADKTLQYSTQLSGDTFVQVQAGRFPDIEMLYREAAMLVTDYSSCFIDYTLTGRPMVSFAYDLEAYKIRERGLFYELEDVFPGPVAQDFSALMDGLDTSAKKIKSAPDAQYLTQRNFFIKHTDGQNAARVVARTKDINTGSQLAAGFQVNSGYKKPKSIAFLYAIDKDPSNRHRVFTLAAQLRMMGWTCYTMDINHAVPDILTKVEYVSFSNLSLSTRTMDLAAGVRATGGKVIYDTDTLMHDEAYLLQSDDFVRTPKLANRLALHRKKIADLMMLADGFTAPTSTILDSLASYQRPVCLVENGLSQAVRATYPTAPERTADGQTNLVYITTATTGATDFDVCQTAVTDILLNRTNVVLHIIGPMDAAHLTDRVNADQIRQHGQMPHSALHALLRTMDIHLAPLTDTPFNDAVNTIHIAQAALHGVPTIASPSGPYSGVITDRKTGYLARSTQDWKNALYEVVDNMENRHKISMAAHAEIVPASTDVHAAKQLIAFLEQIASQ